MDRRSSCINYLSYHKFTQSGSKFGSLEKTQIIAFLTFKNRKEIVTFRRPLMKEDKCDQFFQESVHRHDHLFDLTPTAKLFTGMLTVAVVFSGSIFFKVIASLDGSLLHNNLCLLPNQLRLSESKVYFKSKTLATHPFQNCSVS